MTTSQQTTTPAHTLRGSDYHSEQIFALERERIFHRSWYYVGRAENVTVGHRLVVDVAGESVLIMRDRDDRLYAHANVCRHRGAQLCAESGPGPEGSISCPYHAFTYAADGRLIATPNVDAGELDRDALSLWSIALEVWQGFMFVNLGENPLPLVDWFELHHDDSPLPFAHHDMGSLRVGRRTVSEVAANWKILVENYMECLHCPRVHPELIEVVPFYRHGAVLDPKRTDGGVALAPGATGFSPGGQSSLPLLPTMTDTAAAEYYGLALFPNMLLDVTGTSIIATELHPRSAGHTTVVTEYLFAADTVAAPDFDPHEVVDFNELVGHQDYVVCEMVQRGVASRRFDHGVLTSKDAEISRVNERYLSERGPADIA